MSEPRSRKTSEHSSQLIKLVADGVAMRAQIAALEQRVQRLETELAATRDASRAGSSANKPAAGPPPLPKGPQGLGGAPSIPRTAALPKIPPVPPAPAGAATSARTSRKSVVDISEIAELVDSIPPPAPARPRK
jgi:hypothetical protein